ncbi:uncharacterized protein LOC127899834 [Citrus sinensis]|uniref:uncharacterized protein LOC127899834 n=1 Tax=Citrus sinensis TaxID=2711 RepID=UPI00227741C3|nr:uncharacterized protein LOC127899834 [Citrus sinensis]
MSESSENPESHENPSLLKTIPPPLPEDCSTKKALFRSHGMDADYPPLLSFKDALMPHTQQRSFDDTEMDEEWDFEPGDVIVGDDGAMPTIKFSQRIHEKLVKPWQKFVVVKLLGRNIGYKVLCNRLKVMWHMIPDFSIGQLVGNVIKIHYHTELRKRGKFARIAVHISLTQPLVSQFNLDGRIQKVEYEGLLIICYQCGKYGHNRTVCFNRQNLNGVNEANSENSPLANESVDKIGVSTVANSTSERFGPWMVVVRKGRARVVVDKENITDSERNQRNNFNTTSRFATLSVDYNAPTVEEFAVQNPIHAPPQQPTTSITDHFNTRKNTTLKTFHTLKPHNHMSKGKQVAKPQFLKPKQQHSTASSSMHAKLRPHVTKILSHTTNDPNPSPLRLTPSDPVEFTFNLTTLDPTKHTAVTLPIRCHCRSVTK